MIQTQGRKQYETPSVAICSVQTDVLTTSVGAKFMDDDWNVMDIENK